ncbi:MAG: deoxyribose-phosphate aldolase [Thermoprotei archaeon]|nr:deoxyribose-phosphate aldolase [Thermoprotei archaeon]
MEVLVDRFRWALSLSPRELAGVLESTLLDPTAPLESYFKLIEEAAREGFHCIVIPSSVVKLVERKALDHGVKICTVSGFPSGLSTLKSKIVEVEEALSHGALEVDVVPNFTLAKAEFIEDFLRELSSIVDVSKSYGATVKVIVEAPLHSDGELEVIVETSAKAGASFVKTSTGVYSKGGDPLTVYRVYKLALKHGLKVKAAGGIRGYVDAIMAIAFGADRLGTSSAGQVIGSMLKFKGYG